MNIDKGFVFKLLDAGLPAIREAQAHIPPDFLLDLDAKKAYQLLLEHIEAFGSPPSINVIYSKLGISLDDPITPYTDSHQYFSNEILNRYLFTLINTEAKAAAQVNNSKPNQPLKALDLLSDLVEKGKALRIGDEKVILLTSPEIMDGVTDKYMRMKAGERGIPTPWPSFTEATLGLWPEDFWLMGARAGKGKTWMALQVSQTAWAAPNPNNECGHNKVLFVSTEISQEVIASRWVSLKLSLPYKEFRAGQLGTFMEDKLFKETGFLKEETGFYLMGGTFHLQVDSIEAAIEECKPDLVVIDGIYLLQGKGKDAFEQARNVYHAIKRMAKTKKIPIFATTQLNRDAKKDQAKTASSENIAMSDAGIWDTDVYISIFQDDSMLLDKRMKLSIQKNREGTLVEILVRNDFSEMCFLEVTGEPLSGFTSQRSELHSGVEAILNPKSKIDLSEVPF